MGRETEINQPPADAPEILPARIDQIEAAQDALAVQATTVKALAVQLGYEGALTVGSLEDEIRFYQQRSVEALLETGKRLLLLKQMAAHGEFEQRVQMLGFSLSSAQRFMQAAAKTSKSPKLGDLSVRAKSSAAFLELITHDDDVLENLSVLDGFDRMSASQLRAKVREMEAEGKANQAILDNKNAKLDKLEREKKRIQAAAPNDALTDLHKEMASLANEAMGAVQGRVRQGFAALAEHHANHGGDSRQVMAGYVAQLQQLLNELRDDFNLPDAVGDGTPAWQRWADAQDSAAAVIPGAPETH